MLLKLVKLKKEFSIDTDEKSNIDISFSAKYMMDCFKKQLKMKIF